MEIENIISFIRDINSTKNEIPLHVPTFDDLEDKFLTDVIKSTHVSSFGKYIEQFEENLKTFTSAKSVVATSSGTSALHASLFFSGVRHNDVVITQALTFVATGNAILQCGAVPVFTDVSKSTMGMCPKKLEEFLVKNAKKGHTNTHLKKTKQRVVAVVPMHTFGHPVEIDAINKICKEWNLVLIEDAAESLGSFYKSKHTGTFGKHAVLSFNGNKIITTGGGGAIISKKIKEGREIKHIISTAKKKHAYEFNHDQQAFNYRMPNLNAALGSAQFKKLKKFLKQKRELASIYENFFRNSDYIFFKEPKNAKSNYWLNAIECENRRHRDIFLKTTNAKGILTRPIWTLLTKLPMFHDSIRGDLNNSIYFEDRIVNLPSTPLKL